MLKLYYSPQSCALASHITLEEAGADYEAVTVNFAANEQNQAAFLALNPKGRVPALVTEEGVLTETPAILIYLAQRFPAANLAPLNQPFAFAQLQSFNSYLCSTVHVAHAHGRRGYRWANEESSFADMAAKLPETIGACFDLIERDMLSGPWVMGEQYSVADAYLFTLTGWIEGDGVPLSRYPKVKDHWHRVAARPAVAKVLSLHG